MWDRHPVSLALVHMLPEVADARGLALAPLLARAGIGADGIGENRGANRVVSRAQVSTLLQEFARRAGTSTIGLDLAEAADPLRLGLAIRALLAGRTLREGLQAHALHMPTLQGGVSLSLDEADGRACWRHALADSDAAHAGVLNEGIAAFVVAALRAIAGTEGGELHVGLPHQARAPRRVYEDKLQAGVSFGNGVGIAVSFDAAWLDRPNALFGGPLLPAGETAALADRTEWLDDAALMAALERLFASAALAGSLSLVDASRSLGLAPRSLQRRLAAMGTSFEALVDGWRRAEARRHLADPGLAVGAVARLLGYRDPAHFIRAFRRWEGRTPLAWRRTEMA